jgi:hypothetical protein
MAVNMAKLKVFAGKFVRDLAAVVHSWSVVFGEDQELYKALAERHLEFSRARTTGMEVARCMGLHSDTKFSERCATGWRKRRRLFDLRQRVIAAAALACILFASNPSYSVTASKYDDPVVRRASRFSRFCNREIRAPPGSRAPIPTPPKWSGLCTSR